MPVTETLIAARPTLRHQLEVGLHAGQQQQHQDAELRDRIDHAFCSRRPGKSACCSVRPERAEHRGPEQDAGEQLPHDGGLADPLHGLAQQAPDQQQRSTSWSEEDDFRRAAACGRSAASGAERSAEHANRPAATSQRAAGDSARHVETRMIGSVQCDPPRTDNPLPSAQSVPVSIAIANYLQQG